jgi:hypothetical protein
MNSTTTTQTRFRTGERSQVSGRYNFDGYLDGSRHPTPHPAEQAIPLSKGEIFPPVRSAGKPCWWKLVERI